MSITKASPNSIDFNWFACHWCETTFYHGDGTGGMNCKRRKLIKAVKIHIKCEGKL